jgi:hypothetical protein
VPVSPELGSAQLTKKTTLRPSETERARRETCTGDLLK